MNVMGSYDSLGISSGLNRFPGPGSEPGPEFGPMETSPSHTKNRVENSPKTSSSKTRNFESINQSKLI